jgi:threonine dehydratase
VSDEQMRAAMRTIFFDLKLGVEPAGAAATAALCGPLKERLAGKRVGVITCGANIDIADFCRLTSGPQFE